MQGCRYQTNELSLDSLDSRKSPTTATTEWWASGSREAVRIEPLMYANVKLRTDGSRLRSEERVRWGDGRGRRPLSFVRKLEVRRGGARTSDVPHERERRAW